MWNLYKKYSSQTSDMFHQFLMHIEGIRESEDAQLIRAIIQGDEKIALELIKDMKIETLKKAMHSRNGLYWADKDSRGLDLVVGLGLSKVLEALYAKIPELMSSLNNDLLTILHIAVGTNQPELVELILSKNSELIDQIDNKGFTFLQISSINGYDKVVEKLLPKMHQEQISKIFERNPDNCLFYGNNALHFAAIFNHVEVAKLLINHAPYLVNIRELNMEQTPIYMAISNSSIDIALMLIDKMARDELIDKGNGKNGTPLMSAYSWLQVYIRLNVFTAQERGNCIKAQNIIIDKILEKVDSNILWLVGKEFYIKLQCAINAEPYTYCSYIPSISDVALDLIKYSPQVINMLSKDSPNLLKKALLTLNQEQIQVLVEAINLEDNMQVENQPILHWAIAQENVEAEIVEALCSKASDMQLNSIDNEGKTLLHIIAEKGKGYYCSNNPIDDIDEDEVGGVLISENNYRESERTIKIVQILLDYLSIDTIEAVDNNYQTALHIAASRNLYQTCKLLSNTMSFYSLYELDINWKAAMDLISNPEIKQTFVAPIEQLVKYLVEKFSEQNPTINYDHYSVFNFYQTIQINCPEELYNIAAQHYPNILFDELIAKVDHYYQKNFFTITGVCKQMQKFDVNSDIPILPPHCLSYIAYFIIYPNASEYVEYICSLEIMGDSES